MKLKVNVSLLCLISLLLLSFTLTTSHNFLEPNKRALIIAISAYDKENTGWGMISADNDIPLIKGALLKLGFMGNNIAILKDDQATKDGILNKIKELANQTKSGDMVVIHVSSHGQQIYDDNNDEIDELDEAIVAYGAPANERMFQRTRGADVKYDGNLHLRDEVFGQAINGIRVKAGKNGHVLVIMDNCHSGTGTRGAAKVRGGEAPLVPQGWKPKASTKSKDVDGGMGFYSEAPKSRGGVTELAKFVVISGATAHELNYETKDDNDKDVGSLSYSISKTLQNMAKGTTYRKLFVNIQSEMAVKAPKQNPQIEGDIDYEIFGGSYIAQEKYFIITKLAPTEISINAGKLNGINEGATISVESPGSAGPDKDGKSLAKGKVVRATNFESTIALESTLNIKNKMDGWVFVTSQSLPENKVKVDLSPIRDPELKAALINSISNLVVAELVTSNSDISIQPPSDKSRGAYSLELFSTAYNSSIVDKPIVGNDYTNTAEICKNLIHNYSQGKMFKELNLSDPNYNVVITRFIPLKAGSQNLSDSIDFNTLLDQGGTVIVPEGTRLFIEIQNKSRRSAYFNIVDIEPSGKINPLLPIVDQSGVTMPPPIELKLMPGEKKILRYPIVISPPYGNELFKVIVTGEPFDLASTINTKGQAAMTRGAGQPSVTAIEKLMGKSFQDSFQSTRGASQDFDIEYGTSTSAFTFVIVKK